MGGETVAEVLAASRLFRGTSLDRGRLRAIRVQRGQVVGDALRGVPCVGLVANGTIDVYSVAMDGREVLLSSLEAGESFGVCYLFVQNDMPTVLRAREEGTVLLVPKDYLLAKMREDFDLALRYMELCNEKIQFLLSRIEELTLQTAHDKLLDYLHSHADARGRVRFEGSRDELANYLGMSRTALYREIAALKRSGEVTADGLDLVVGPRAASPR